MKDKRVRAQYTREFKLEAVRQVRSGQPTAVVARVSGHPRRVWATGCRWRPKGR